MYRTIMLARKAKNTDEIPVGSILVLNNRIIGEGKNCSINNYDPTAHAEIIALRSGGKKIKNYRLINTELYVTLEPCIMCLGAIINARIRRLIFGAFNKKKKKEFIFIKMLNITFNNKIIIKGGVLEKLCSNLLKNFFINKR